MCAIGAMCGRGCMLLPSPPMPMPMAIPMTMLALGMELCCGGIPGSGGMSCLFMFEPEFEDVLPLRARLAGDGEPECDEFSIA